MFLQGRGAATTGWGGGELFSKQQKTIRLINHCDVATLFSKLLKGLEPYLPPSPVSFRPVFLVGFTSTFEGRVAEWLIQSSSVD